MTDPGKDARHPLQGILATLAYKPGWRFELASSLNYLTDETVWRLCVRYDAPDRDHPDRIARQKFIAHLPPWEESAEFWLGWLWVCVILEIEHHEAAEFFVVDGVRVYDPHLGEELPRAGVT